MAYDYSCLSLTFDYSIIYWSKKVKVKIKYS